MILFTAMINTNLVTIITRADILCKLVLIMLDIADNLKHGKEC